MDTMHGGNRSKLARRFQLFDIQPHAMFAYITANITTSKLN